MAARATTTRNSWMLEGLMVILVAAVIGGGYQLGMVYAQLQLLKPVECNCKKTICPIKKVSERGTSKPLGYVIHKQKR